jgi:hypothetical protein
VRPGSSPELPAALRQALGARAANIVESWQEGRRTYARAESPAGALFARSTADPSDRAVLAHEHAVRRIVGDEGVLRAPPVVAAGSDWLLEAAIEPEPPAGPVWVDTAAAAAAVVATLVLPDPPTESRAVSLGVVGRRWRALRSPVPIRDIARARSILAHSRLPSTTSHGDFHPRNILVADGAAWVIDWELSGRRPAGYDFMQLWAALEDGADRARVFDAAVAMVGVRFRPQLLSLRYALAVWTAVGKLASRHEFDRDPAGGRTLIGALPDLRAEAGIRE